MHLRSAGLHSEFQVCQSYIVRSYLKNQLSKNKYNFNLGSVTYYVIMAKFTSLYLSIILNKYLVFALGS